MSFAERNKRWLLPLLGLGIAGVFWLQFGAGTPEPPAGKAAPTGTAHPEVPEESPTPADALKPLEPPPPGANDAAPLLQAGRRPLASAVREATAAPALHPDQWRGLAAFTPQAPAQAPGSTPPPTPPPPLDFIIETGKGREVWMQGRGFRPGAVLEGGYLLKHINPAGIVVTGPGGDQERPLVQGQPPRPKLQEKP